MHWDRDKFAHAELLVKALKKCFEKVEVPVKVEDQEQQGEPGYEGAGQARRSIVSQAGSRFDIRRRPNFPTEDIYADIDEPGRGSLRQSGRFHESILLPDLDVTGNLWLSIVIFGDPP